MSEIQSYANHRRMDPWYHYGAAGLLLLALILAIKDALHGARGFWEVVVTLALILVWAKVRLYALRVQDRVIRLEETQRLTALVPPELQARMAQLKPGQFVALRFAADAELATRMAEALDEQLSGEAIKQRIQQWRPDTFRV